MPREKEYTVTFVGDFFSTDVCVQGVEDGDEDSVIDLAANILQFQYGWDIKAASTVAIEVGVWA